MPPTRVIFFANADGTSPLFLRFEDWPKKVVDKSRIRIGRLQELGHELRRPEADYLRDGIYELRLKHIGVNYRILYFFHEQVAVLFDGLTKEDIVPIVEIERAVSAKASFAKKPHQHTYAINTDED